MQWKALSLSIGGITEAYNKTQKEVCLVENTSENKQKKQICAALLAHVDAGKTTLSESILYQCRSIRKLGRVDKGDAFLDTHALERARGITIFSKQAVFTLGDEVEVTLLDTPGHVDFSAEMERTLQVLDYAILVISGADGVQGHTKTLWRLLYRYGIPVFLFVNKMDQAGADKAALLEEIKKHLHKNCVDFSADQDEEVFFENLALCDDDLLEKYLETGSVKKQETVQLIAQRKLFPCYFGSALKMMGVEELLWGLQQYTRCPIYPQKFGAKIYKIARDEQGNRLTYMKITGGSLKVKSLLTNARQKETGESYQEDSVWTEKVEQIRIYSGAKYTAVNEVQAGAVCAVTGLSRTYPGEGLGIQSASDLPVLEPMLLYQILLPPDCDVHQMLLKLRQLEEEEPQLHIMWDERQGEIHAQLMGEVQTEILKSLILERFGVTVEFGEGSIVYKETLLEPTLGVGHFEPLRHYAEVHLLMEPGKPGSGLTFAEACSEDMLDRNWQRLILTHLEEKEHKGVLTGSAITDMKITLIAGQAHQKHTEGGDFRQATYRAVRQGLKKAKCMLLEPYYEYCLEIPSEMVGRAMSDIQRMHGTFQPPEIEGDMSVLTGSAPAATMRGYQTEVISYSRGQGRLFCEPKGYEPCHNAEEVINRMGYDAERDLDNPTGSVFCSHGAGFVVKWDQVEEYMHIESTIRQKETVQQASSLHGVGKKQTPSSAFGQEEKELEEIFLRTYGTSMRKTNNSYNNVRTNENRSVYKKPKTAEKVDEYLLVDGYNIIFSWEELKALAEVNIDAARDKLMDILSNYQGYKKCILILVFDAYKVEGNPGEVLQYKNIHVVYTKEAETADQYIEKTVHAIGRKYHVTVATSDGLEQVIIRGQGGNLLSAQGLKEEVEIVNREIQREWEKKRQSSRNYLFHHMTDEMADYMEEVRLGKKEIK